MDTDWQPNAEQPRLTPARETLWLIHEVRNCLRNMGIVR